MRLLGSVGREGKRSSPGVGARAMIRRSLWPTLLGPRRPKRVSQIEIGKEGWDGAPWKLGVANASSAADVGAMNRRPRSLTLFGFRKEEQVSRLGIRRHVYVGIARRPRDGAARFAGVAQGNAVIRKVTLATLSCADFSSHCEVLLRMRRPRARRSQIPVAARKSRSIGDWRSFLKRDGCKRSSLSVRPPRNLSIGALASSGRYACSEKRSPWKFGRPLLVDRSSLMRNSKTFLARQHSRMTACIASSYHAAFRVFHPEDLRHALRWDPAETQSQAVRRSRARAFLRAMPFQWRLPEARTMSIGFRIHSAIAAIRAWPARASRQLRSQSIRAALAEILCAGSRTDSAGPAPCFRATSANTSPNNPSADGERP